MIYHPSTDPLDLLAESRKWDHVHARQFARFVQPHRNNRDPDRRLRVGYLSADFRSHAVSRFVLPMIESHDKKLFEVFCYSNVRQPDAVTAKYQSCVAGWRDILQRSDEQAAGQIRQDQIDILVDLSGHTTDNRLLIFARKPAPVQVNYQGYPASTGMETIEYRITDGFADPPGMTESHHTETLVRLDPTNWCYWPAEDAPPVGGLPALSSKSITFASFNNFSKLNDPLFELWMQILESVPNSRLIIKAKALSSATARTRVLGHMAKHGISLERVEMIGWLPNAEHIRLFNRVDIALESHPYHGTTTTCDNLWMGVPVVTLAGRTHVSRVGVSLLNNIGLPELIADSPDGYVQIAAGLASDLSRLAELRRTLRQRMQDSVLVDSRRFARSIESAYRMMWRRWCARQEDR
jgi:predicted O-linked N-acetylglucosamine transferase (SPINDLY family)